jgi:hypothetical protein
MNMLEKTRSFAIGAGSALRAIAKNPGPVNYRKPLLGVFVGAGVLRWLGVIPGGTATEDMQALWSLLVTLLEIAGG